MIGGVDGERWREALDMARGGPPGPHARRALRRRRIYGLVGTGLAVTAVSAIAATQGTQALGPAPEPGLALIAAVAFALAAPLLVGAARSARGRRDRQPRPAAGADPQLPLANWQRNEVRGQLAGTSRLDPFLLPLLIVVARRAGPPAPAWRWWYLVGVCAVLVVGCALLLDTGSVGFVVAAMTLMGHRTEQRVRRGGQRLLAEHQTAPTRADPAAP